MAQNNNNTDIKETMSLQKKECSLCGGTDEVGLNGCDCEDVLICKHCDIDGVNYDGWCKCGDCDTDYNTQTDPPYYCDGGCGKIVGEGWDHDCERVCPDCKEEQEEEEEEEEINNI